MNFTFHYPQTGASAPHRTIVCIPRFLGECDTPALLKCMHENARFLVQRWGKETTQRVLEECSRDPSVTCDSAGVLDGEHVHAVHEAVEILVRDTVPQAVFGGDSLFLRDADGLAYSDIVRCIERIQRFLGIADHVALEVWAVMPVFYGIILAGGEYGRRDDNETWLGNAWKGLSESGKRAVARALRDETDLAHISCTLSPPRLEVLKRLSAPFCGEP